MTRIALLGGSFNPPHLGHVGIARYVVDHQLADEVWVLPTASHPYAKPLAPFADRMAMCTIAFQGIPQVTVSDVEAKLPPPSFTVQTLRHISRSFAPQKPGAQDDTVELFLIVGSDIIADVPNWKDSAEIQRLATVIEVPRGPDSIIPNVSATEIRDRIARRKIITDLVPMLVAQYIQAHQLYR